MQTRLLQRLPDMRLASYDELPLRPANFVSGLESMPVKFSPTKPLGVAISARLRPLRVRLRTEIATSS
jgi:hypothetical protein